jgi:hypothetical protein
MPIRPICRTDESTASDHRLFSAGSRRARLRDSATTAAERPRRAQPLRNHIASCSFGRMNQLAGDVLTARTLIGDQAGFMANGSDGHHIPHCCCAARAFGADNAFGSSAIRHKV